MSTVIKAGGDAKVLGGLSTLDLADHADEARRIIREGRRRAAQILTDARRERDRLLSEIRKTAYEAGYKDGYQQGATAGRETAYNDAMQRFTDANAQVTSDLIRVVDEVDGTKQDLRIAAERELLEFALRLTAKLTFALGRARHESATSNLQRALELVQAKTDLVVRAHPDDVEALASFAESARARLEESHAMRVVPDDSIAPGGCVVRTEATEVDARLETQVDELVSLLLAEHLDHG